MKPLTYFDEVEDVTVERLNLLIDEIRRMGGESEAVEHTTNVKVTGGGGSTGIQKIKDNAGADVVPIGGTIQVTDDGVVNADQDTTNKLALSVSQAQIDHGTIGGLDNDDHEFYKRYTLLMC